MSEENVSPLSGITLPIVDKRTDGKIWGDLEVFPTNKALKVYHELKVAKQMRGVGSDGLSQKVKEYAEEYIQDCVKCGDLKPVSKVVTAGHNFENVNYHGFGVCEVDDYIRSRYHLTGPGAKHAHRLTL